MYDDKYIIGEGHFDGTTFEEAQANVNTLNSAPSSTVYYISTEDDFYADMPPLIPVNVN